jgi:enoyl-CoA hydratase/carnithine racemase
MDYEQIVVERREKAFVLTLNRPDRLNAWTPRMGSELIHALHAANDDADVSVVVVTGAGRGFCAGIDIGSEFATQLDHATGEEHEIDETMNPWVRLCRESKPIIGALNGAAIGMGLTLALPFDYLIASRTAKLSARFVKMGVTPELMSSHFLVSRCGWGAESWLALSGETVTGEDALKLRLVDAVSDPEHVFQDALRLAETLGRNPVPQMRSIKRLLTANAVETDLEMVHSREYDALKEAFETPEHRESVQAFVEGREPVFRSR